MKKVEKIDFCIELKYEDINIFGEMSDAHVEIKDTDCLVVRDLDGCIMGKSDWLRNYPDTIIRTMYTGTTKNKGNYVLKVDVALGHIETLYTCRKIKEDN